MKDVPSNITIIRRKIWEPYQLAEKLNKSNKKFKAGQFDIGKNQSWKSKLSIWIRGNFFIPDARIFWVKPSIKFLKKYLKDNHVDAFVTTGPPHSLHLIGLGLKKEFPHLKWIADFRDPWTEISYYQHLKLTKNSDTKHRKLEQQVFENADITLATSYTDAENFSNKGANAVCITNGFDDEFPDSSEKKQTAPPPKFTLSYIGVLEQLRNPQILWNILEKLITENKAFKEDLELKFVGRIDDQILNQIKNQELRNSVKNLGYLPHEKALKEMKSSDILLITNFPEERSKGIIPGKIFEYLATGKQILSFGPQNADVEKILEKTNTGRHFSYDNEVDLTNFIREQYNLWKNGDLLNNPVQIEEFSRKNLTKKLSEIL